MVDCSPLFNYGTTGGTWSYRGEGNVSMTVAPEEGGLRLDLAGTSGSGCSASAAMAVPRWPTASRRTSLCPGAAAASPEAGGGRRGAERHRRLLARLAERGQGARPSVPALPRAQRADPQGAELRSDRRHHGRGDHLAARDAGRGAQLGLPLHLDPGFGVMLRSLYELGFGWEAIEYFGFIIDAVAAAAATGHSSCRSCTASAVNGSSPATLDHLSGWRGPARSGWATAPGTSASMTPGGWTWMRSTSSSGGMPPRSRCRCGRAWPGSCRPPSSTGVTRTRGSGRSGASRSTSPPPR